LPHCCSVETRVPSRCRRESNAARPTFRPPSPFALKLAQTLRSRSARARLQGHGPAGSSRSAFALASPNLEGEPGGETPAPSTAPPRGVSVRRIQSRTDRLSFGLSSSAPPWGDRRAQAFGLSPPTPRCREGGAALAMLVPEAEQDWPPRSPPAGASHDTLLDHAWSGSRGVDAVVAGGCGSNGVTSAARICW